MSDTEKPVTIKGKNGGRREGSGRKPFCPTEEERKKVETLSGYGLPFDHIAVLIRDGIDLETLTKYFKGELVTGKAKANGKMANTLYQKAMGGDTTAMIWWTKTQMRWAETQKLEHTGKDGQALNVQIVRFGDIEK